MLVVVGSYPLLPEARVVCSYLQAYGVEAVVFDENILSYFPEAYFAIGGFRVAVLEHEAAEARQLLREVQPLPLEPEDAEQPVERPPFRLVDQLTAGLSAFFGLLLSVPFVRTRWRRRD